MRVDPPDKEAPVYRARVEGGYIQSLVTHMFGERQMLFSPGGVFDGGRTLRTEAVGEGSYRGEWGSIDWLAEPPFSFKVSVATEREGLEFLLPLAEVERVFDDRDLTLPAPVSGRRLLAMLRWTIEFEFIPFAEVGESQVRIPIRRVLCLESSVDGTISESGVWRVPIYPGVDNEMRITVRWPLISEPDTYPTHDGHLQWWRTITVPELPDGPRPLFVGLHGSGNAADNFLGLSNPCWSGSWRGVLPALLGGVLVAPNANDAPGPEGDPAEMPRPAMYNKAQGRYVFDAIDEADRRWGIDRDRIYIMGGSMGGHGALTMSAHHPDRFAAAVAVVPLTNMETAWRHLNQFEDPGRAKPEMLETFGGTPDEVPIAYAQGSVLGIAENLMHVPVIFRGGIKDPVVPAADHVVPLQLKLEKLGYDFVASVNPEGHHVDSNTVEETYELALPYLLPRPSVAKSPDRVVYKTADLYWNSAYWLRIDELAGEGFGTVDVKLDRGRAVVEVDATGVAEITIDVDAAGVDVEATVTGRVTHKCKVRLISGRDVQETVLAP